MTLRQQVEQLIGEWDGSDVTERDQKRQELVTALIRLLQPAAEQQQTQPQTAAA